LPAKVRAYASAAKGSGAKEFVAATWNNWVAGMSGLIGVAAFMFAPWLPNVSAQTIALCTAFAGIIFAAYRVWKSERERVIALEIQLETKAIESDTKWPIHDLFYYLKPDIVDGDPNETLWVAIGQLVRDKLALGTLKAWGRPTKADLIGELVGDEEMAAPEPIGEDYWRRAKFSYTFLSRSGQFEIHTYPDKKSDPAYCDVQLNKAQALLIWPTSLAGTQWEANWKLKKNKKRMWDLVKDGVELRNDGLWTTDIEQWTKQFNAWRDSVLKIANAISADLKNHLETMDLMSPLPEGSIVEGNHAINVNVASEMVLRMRKYLTKEL